MKEKHQRMRIKMPTHNTLIAQALLILDQQVNISLIQVVYDHLIRLLGRMKTVPKYVPRYICTCFRGQAIAQDGNLQLSCTTTSSARNIKP